MKPTRAMLAWCRSRRYERRPDLVLYLNGIAIGVIALKRSSVEVADGVRQLITNQEEIFNKAFFATIQLVFAGSDSQGLRYGTVTTKDATSATPTGYGPSDLQSAYGLTSAAAASGA